MKKAENVVKFYILCSRLKDLIRTGWKDWNVKRERIESVAEHIYKTQMLAIAVKYEYEIDADIEKIVMMLALHELEEIIIGDLTSFQISREEKQKIGREAVNKILNGMLLEDKVKSLIDEFEERKTKEAKFAYFCDKFECDLQAKLYDLEGCVDVLDQEENTTADDEEVKKLLASGMSFSSMWITYDKNKINFDKTFNELADYVIENDISKFDSIK